MAFFSPLDVEKGFSRDYFKVRLRLTMKKTLEKPFSTSRGEKNAISTPEKKICDQKNFSVHLNSTNHHENSYSKVFGKSFFQSFWKSVFQSFWKSFFQIFWKTVFQGFWKSLFQSFCNKTENRFKL